MRFVLALALLAGFRPEVVRAGATFARDVAPILYRHCAMCHRPGQPVPFALLSYRDAAKHAREIAQAAEKRIMPPWQPEPGYGRFAGDRRLSGPQIEVLRKWAGAGAPEGDARRAPPPPRFPEGWESGVPDKVVRMRRPYSVPAGGADQYRCFVIPLDFTRDRYVRVVEFHPGAYRVLHHALFFLDSSGLARRKDPDGNGYQCFGAPGFLPSGALGGWTPGTSPIHMQGDVPVTVRRGTDLVIQIHYHPTGKAEQDQSSLGLYFSDKPPTRHVMDVALGSNRIDIPPGDRVYKVTDHFTLPVAVDAVGIIPHAHFICRDMKGWATLPDGTRKWLIWIRNWNFNWQEQYHYAEPLRLPADTELHMEFTYDNSADNPRNPNHPPKRVVWGPGSTDEMAGLHVQVIPVRDSDASELGQSLWGKFMRMMGGGFYRPPAPVGK